MQRSMKGEAIGRGKGPYHRLRPEGMIRSSLINATSLLFLISIRLPTPRLPHSCAHTELDSYRAGTHPPGMQGRPPLQCARMLLENIHLKPWPPFLPSSRLLRSLPGKPRSRSQSPGPSPSNPLLLSAKHLLVLCLHHPSQAGQG